MAKKKFSITKEIRKLARERVGTVPSSKIVVPKFERKEKYRKFGQDLIDSQ